MSRAITIDSSTTRDRDDAVWVQLDGGEYLIDVYISDVASTVPRGSRFDIGDETKGHKGARQRLETRYLRDHNIPMLPRFLSEDRLSLHPGKERRAIRIRIRLDGHLYPVGRATISQTLLKSSQAISYDQVAGILRDSSHELHADIGSWMPLALALMANRHTSGAMAFYDLHRGWATNEEGRVVKLRQREDTLGYVLIQELMILANTQLATLCSQVRLPILYRNHTARSCAPDRADIQSQIELAMGGSIDDMHTLQQRLGLVFERADYGPQLRGHYGLKLAAYGHFTSPIRRYADLVNWRQLLAWLKEETPLYTQDELTELSEEMNSELQRRREARSERFRLGAERRLHSQMHGDHYAQLSEKELERALHLLCESPPEEPPERLEDTLRSRMRASSLSCGSQLLLLLEMPASGRWTELREVICESLTAAPHQASILLNTGAQKGYWSQLACETNAKGSDHERCFISRTRLVNRDGRQHWSQTVSAGTSKLSKQRAAVVLICELCSSARPRWADENPTRAPVAVSTAKEGRSPVAVIMEHCQQHKIKQPTFEFQMLGAAHTPTCRCTGHAPWLPEPVVVQQPGTKKAAKRACCAAIVHQLGKNGR